MTLREELIKKINSKIENERFDYLERALKAVGIDKREVAIRRWINEYNKLTEYLKKEKLSRFTKFEYEFADEKMEVLKEISVIEMNLIVKRFSIKEIGEYVKEIKNKILDETKKNDTYNIVVNAFDIEIECETKISIDEESIKCQLKDNDDCKTFENNGKEYILIREEI